MTDQPGHRNIVSFARRSGRLDPRRQRVWDELAGAYVVEPPRAIGSTSVDPAYAFDPLAAFGRAARLVVEIGSGRGDAVAEAAAQSPDTNFLALEVWRPGVATTLTHLRRFGLTNVRLMEVDAAVAMATMFTLASIEEVWLFFPDPWHKQRHHKRRLVTPGFAGDVARVLKPGGVWRLATDWAHYADQMRRVLDDSPHFDAGDAPRFDGRTTTRFERKGAGLGRAIHDLTAVRI